MSYCGLSHLLPEALMRALRGSTSGSGLSISGHCSIQSSDAPKHVGRGSDYADKHMSTQKPSQQPHGSALQTDSYFTAVHVHI